MDGIVAVHKAPGMTSHDVVAMARRITKERSCGHTGTLDPGATGVLVLCFGKSTRLSQFLMDLPKEYVAEMVYGVSTDTGDSEGRITSADSDFAIPLSAVCAAIEGFQGEIEQIPPMVSAVHHEGRRLYELAREGIEVARTPRRVIIHQISPVDVGAWPDPVVPGSRGQIRVRCSKGTYIRTLCQDICKSLGVSGHMGSLVRTESAGFTLAESVTLGQLEEAAREGVLDMMVHEPARGIRHMLTFELTQVESARVACGAPVLRPASSAADGERVGLICPDGSLAAIGLATRAEQGIIIRPVIVFNA
ncbi:MAG: tRNA pseudouridine(55) synthase TruB [Clostridia bacterium]|nr:tRNA pseudouridine(55) synthase TruB [Clostridia bacterium]